MKTLAARWSKSPQPPAHHTAPGATLICQGRCLPNPPILDATGDGGVFYVRRVKLPGGHALARLHLQFGSDSYSPAAHISIVCYTLDSSASLGRIDASVQSLRDTPDAIFLPLFASTPGEYEIRAHVSEHASRTHLRALFVHAAKERREVNYFHDYRGSHYGNWPVSKLRNVILGTTGVCNASCIHCPTNKPQLAHLQRLPMAMTLFRKIVDGIATEGLEIEGLFTFGLHGDALMDPLVVERARYVRARLPHARVLINTNGGPFNERKHAPLVDLVECFSVHCEALTPALFEHLMPPLKAQQVFPKIERLAAIAKGKISMAVPVSRQNVAEFPALKAYWGQRGITQIAALPFSNRTRFDFSYYDYTLAPKSGCCRQEVASELIVDWDGKVLTCCQDFEKGNVIGDLTVQSVRETLNSAERRDVFEGLAAGEWSRFRSCRDCLFDSPVAMRQALESQSA